MLHWLQWSLSLSREKITYSGLETTAVFVLDYWKGTINILQQGQSSPLYGMYKAERISSEFKSLRVLFNAALSCDLLQEANRPNVNAKLLVGATNVHRGHVHNGKSCCFLCPVLKNCLAPVTIGLWAGVL